MRLSILCFLLGFSFSSFAVDFSNPVFPGPGNPVFGPPPGSFPGGNFDPNSGCALAQINNAGNPVGAWLEIKPVSEGLQFDLVVCNFTDQDMLLEFSSGQTQDLLIYDRSGQLIWQWSWGRAFIQVMTQMTLAPNQEVLWASIVWPRQQIDFSTGIITDVPRGAYIAVGEIPAINANIRSKCHIVTSPSSPFGFPGVPGGNGFPCDPSAGLQPPLQNNPGPGPSPVPSPGSGIPGGFSPFSGGL